MTNLDVIESIYINAPVDVVRQQFADVRHHADTHVHKGVIFELLHETSTGCRYRQTTRLGPLRLRQEIELINQPDGSSVNQILAGQFSGGAITFTVTPRDEGSVATAHVSAPLHGLQRLVALLLRRTVRRSLKYALIEDRDDVQSGRYERSARAAIKAPVT